MIVVHDQVPFNQLPQHHPPTYSVHRFAEFAAAANSKLPHLLQRQTVCAQAYAHVVPTNSKRARLLPHQTACVPCCHRRARVARASNPRRRRPHLIARVQHVRRVILRFSSNQRHVRVLPTVSAPAPRHAMPRHLSCRHPPPRPIGPARV